MGACVVAIVGGSGAGKTWLAHALHHHLSDLAIQVSLDSFYRDLSYLPPERRSLINFDAPSAIDWAAFATALSDFREGLPARIPRYDFASHTRQADVEELPPAKVVLIEGLWLLKDSQLRCQFQLSVFVNCDALLRRERRLRRDECERGRRRQSILDQFARHVQPMHERHVEPQRHRADVVVQSPIDPDTVERLAQRIRNLATARS